MSSPPQPERIKPSASIHLNSAWFRSLGMGPNALWMVLWMSLDGLVCGYENLSLRECCDYGRASAQDRKDCTVHPLISSYRCSIVFEQCCLTKEKDFLCDEGIIMARDQGACERPFFNGHGHKTETVKMCCDCCSLGVATFSKGLSCEDHEPLMGSVCADVAHICCLRNTKEDINECMTGSHNCGYELICINTLGSFHCRRENRCGPGYYLTANNNCRDVNECRLEVDLCGPSFVCINTDGSYSCLPRDKCATGYVPDAVGTCIDIDECQASSHLYGIHHCVNLVGSFRCDCLAGFCFNAITKACEDINECVQLGDRPCAHKCENTVGSFKCSCTAGFQLASDGRSCDDIDECTLPTGRKACPYRCINTPGSFNCTCPLRGFVPTHEGQKCQDIDECAAGTHTCSFSEQCFNIQGGYRCLSFTCPENFQYLARGAEDSFFSAHCVKDCQPHDKLCALNPIHLITHTILSIPTIRECSQPEEIFVLRTAVSSNPDATDGIDVFFSLETTENHLCFDVVKRSQFGMIIGFVRRVKPIIGPKDIVLEVSMNYVKSGVITHRNVVLVYVFVCEYCH